MSQYDRLPGHEATLLLPAALYFLRNEELISQKLFGSEQSNRCLTDPRLQMKERYEADDKKV